MTIITQRLLVAGAVSALMLTAAPVQAADPTPLTVDVSGSVRIQQSLPCENRLDVTTSIMRGRMELTWLALERDAVLVDLMRLDMFLRPFHVEATCNGIGGFADFREIGIQLAGAVRFTGTLMSGGRDSSLVRFRIPKEQFLIYESVLDNAPTKQPETSYQKPSEDVTGLIDLRRRTVQLHVVLTTELHFRAGCEGARCTIDETHRGMTTSDVLGGTFSRTPPTVLCTPGRRPGNSFQVSASDDAVIKLGTFTLANREVIQLLPGREPGVRLLPSNRGDTMRQFQAGPDDGFLLATTAANLSAIAYCQ